MHDSLESLDERTTVLTVNRRLARTLRGAHDRAKLARGAEVWPSPDILPFDAWLRRCWSEHVETSPSPVPALLGPAQELALWERVVAASGPRRGPQVLLQPGAAARNAQAAWTLLKAWRCARRDVAPLDDETRVFLEWAQACEKRRREGGWLDAAEAPDALETSVAAVVGARARRLLLAGFDRITPQQAALLEALERGGVEVAHWRPAARAGHACRASFATGEAEIDAAAHWARRRAEEGGGGLVGVVVPELAANRGRVSRIFSEVFAPGSHRPGAGAVEPAFNISLGRPLGAVPVVADALLWLGLGRRWISLRQVGRCLLSAYLGSDAEALERARMDALLRRIGEPEWELGALLRRVRRAGETGEARTPAFAATLERGLARIDAWPRRQGLGAWAAAFGGLLADAGWPGERTLESEEYQAVQALRDLLAELASLGAVLPAQGLGQALSHVQRLAARQIFQPRTEAAPVQVLGVLETLGLRFSDLWVTGLHDGAWPEPARPNPFLPTVLQRRLGMPRASVEQQLARAEQWTRELVTSADEVVMSHPLRAGDEPLQPSPLIAGLPRVDDEALAARAAPSDREHIMATAPELLAATDERAPALTGDAPVRGGAGVLKDQAACPFRAFATHRLAARDVSAPEASLDPRVRGKLVHRLLEMLWREIGSQARLLALDEAALEALVARVVARLLEAESSMRPQTLRGRLLEVERGRLEALARGWLRCDAQRAPFEVVAPERADVVSIADLRVELRPDRVDRVGEERYLVVDYKTGAASLSGWLGDRPDEPQLPLYAVTLGGAGGDVVGAAFAVLRSGELGYRGLAAEADLAPGIAEAGAGRVAAAREASDWPALKELWRARLETLAAGFLGGDARVDPKRPGETCRVCGLQPLCRIHERSPGVPGG